MIEVKDICFDLEQIVKSGQCFRMSVLKDGRIEVISRDRRVTAVKDRTTTTFSCDREEFDEYWKEYFDLGTEYSHFVDMTDPNDPYLSSASVGAQGVHILRQDLWETIVTFLISQQNNIARIKKCVQNLCETYGEKKSQNGEEFYAFPTPESLANLPEDALMACNLGYRSKYVVRAARQIVSGEVSLDKIREMPYNEAKEELLKLFGVGEKIAECVCLFSLHKLEAFPVDTHIKQALAKHYPDGFPFEKYAPYQGVMQQYMFYFELYYTKKE